MDIIRTIRPGYGVIRSRYNRIPEGRDKTIISYINTAGKRVCAVVIEQLLEECNKLKLEMKECEIEIVKAKNLITHGKVEVITLSDGSQYPLDFQQQGKAFLDFYTNKLEGELGYQLEKVQQYLQLAKNRRQLLEKPNIDKIKIPQNERQRMVNEACQSGLSLSEYCKKLIYSYLGGAFCQTCRVEDEDVLTFDHKNDDGYLDRERFSSYDDFYLYYTLHMDEAKEKLQVLCFNHNVKKSRVRKKDISKN